MLLSGGFVERIVSQLTHEKDDNTQSVRIIQRAQRR